MRSIISLLTLLFILVSLLGLTTVCYFTITAALAELLKPAVVESQFFRFSTGACSFFLSSCFSLWLVRLVLPRVAARPVVAPVHVIEDPPASYVPKKLTGKRVNGDLSRKTLERDAFTAANMKRLSEALQALD